MKHNFISIALLFSLGLASCQDGDWNKEIDTSYTIGNDTITEHNVVSIKDLKKTYEKAILGLGLKYSNNSVQLVEDEIQLKGVVITNDEGGNLSQCIIVNDNSGENIQISIADNDIMTYLPVGQEILVNLKGLYIGGYSETPQIGYPNEKYSGTVDSESGEIVGSQIYRMSFMSRYTWYKHFKAVGRPDVTRVPDAVELTDAMYDETLNVSRLVYVDGHFASNDGNTKIADPNKVESTDTGNGVNETFVADKCSKSIIVRTSTYADFAAELIPATDVRMYGIMTRDSYKKGFQIQLRNADDIRIFCPGCNEYIGSTMWTRNDNGNYVCDKCHSVVAKS